MIGGRKPEPQQVQIVRDNRPLWLVALVGLCRLVWWLLRTAAAHPVVTAGVAAGLWLRGSLGQRGALLVGLVLVVVLAGGLAVWRWRDSFRAVVVFAVRSKWRWTTVYRRRWSHVMAGCGLTATVDGQVHVPEVLRVESSGWLDRLLVGTVPGQHVDVWARAGLGLAHGFGARSCRVRPLERPATRWGRLLSGRRPRVWVEFTTHRDPLEATVTALPVPVLADLHAVPVGRREDGGVGVLRLLGTHVLVVGVTGAGNGSVVWSLLRGVAEAIAAGTVAVWAIDPKGGMELGFGKPMFARFATDPGDIVTVLEQAVTQMRDRAERLAGVVRLHTPTDVEPLVLVLVDEIASLTAYLADRDLKRRAEAALSLLLSQDRAVGVSVVGAVQDPRKEVLNLRNLFPTRVALRLDEPSQVDMVLGDGAYERGVDALRYEPCSPTCANWLRYGVNPKNPRPNLRPGYCRSKAHRAEHLGYAGRRVLVSRKWSGKNLADHRAERRTHVLAVLAAAGQSADVSATSDPDRFQWQPATSHDPDVLPLSHRLLRSVAERIRWRHAYDAAKTAPDVSATSEAA